MEHQSNRAHNTRQGNFRPQQKPRNTNNQLQSKELAIDLELYRDKSVQVKFSGGRQVIGILKGFDPLLNLVLDNAVEVIRRIDEPETKRFLGLLVCRGPNVLVISPMDGSEEISNPFAEGSEPLDE
jgi:U6 snRNA-associated Sm-like protein LSm7